MKLPEAFHQTPQAQAYREVDYRYEHDDYRLNLRPVARNHILPCGSCGERVYWTPTRQQQRWYQNHGKEGHPNELLLHMIPVCDWRRNCGRRLSAKIKTLAEEESRPAPEPLPFFYRGEMP